MSTNLGNLSRKSNSDEYRDFNLRVEGSRGNAGLQRASELIPEAPKKQIEPKPLPKGKQPKLPHQAFSPSELDAIRGHVSAFGFELSLSLMEKLLGKARHYGVSGFVIASHLERAFRYVQRVPSQKPKGEGWFCSVVENALRGDEY